MPRQKSTHIEDPAALGRRLRDARVRAGLSQRELAFAGCSPAYICRIEAGDRIPSLQLVRELARRLDVSEEYLTTGAEQRRSLLDEAEIALRLDDDAEAQRLFERELAEATAPAQRARRLEGLGQSELAERYARQTLETLRATEDAYAIGHILQTLAQICLDLARPEEALELLREAWPAISSAGTPLEIAQYRIDEARALAALGERE